MRMSKLYAPTLREVPSEAELPSHQLLLRAGMVRMLAAGIYTYLPLGQRVLKKIEAIVREEMDKIDGQEALMSALIPSELWKETGRWADFGPEMFKLHDRHQREFCLGPTHEEVFTNLIRHEIKSYKQLPLNLYQIQTKYRDEKRPRFGLMRSREFIMKDAYTFDKDEAGMKASYEEMWKAYERVFDRCGLNYRIVEGDAGAMGGSDSHEFIALSEIGETEIVYCSACHYAATSEKAEVVLGHLEEEALLEKEMIKTPGVTTIEALKDFFNEPGSRFGKMLLYKAKGELIALMIPGHRVLNEIKLINYLGINEHDLEVASAEDIKWATKAEPGYAGPLALNKEVRLIVDQHIPKMTNMIVGANQTDYHYKGVNYQRDFEAEIAGDLLMVTSEDRCPHCQETLLVDRGNEVGNIFQLGTKYSAAMKATYLDEQGKEQLIVMGSHGIGISRTMAAIIEQSYDEHGIIWPLAVAPYQVMITVVNSKNDQQRELGEDLYSQLKARGVEVLLDDRKERAGVKFKDAELMGIPFTLVVGKQAPEGILEFKTRRSGEKLEVTIDEAMAKLKEVL